VTDASSEYGGRLDLGPAVKVITAPAQAIIMPGKIFSGVTGDEAIYPRTGVAEAWRSS
jgi:hypothetical protein